MWKLSVDQNDKRVYTNNVTNGQCTQIMVYLDKDGNKWWEFDSLSSIPYTRNFAATKITSLYALGLSKDDISHFVNGIKAMAKSQDREKYEKIYALALDFENKAANATDAVKQMSSLVCVYFTMNDEPIDSFDQNLQIKKMALLEADTEMHTFFLTRQVEATQRYTNFLNSISQIALAPTVELPEVLQ